MGFINVDSTDAEKEYFHRNLASPFIPFHSAACGSLSLSLPVLAIQDFGIAARDPENLDLEVPNGRWRTVIIIILPLQDTSPREGARPAVPFFQDRDPRDGFAVSWGGGGDDMKLNVMAYRSVPVQFFAGRGGRDRDPRDGFASARGRPDMESL